MKKLIAALSVALAATTVNAQVGVGTTSPNSTLDVRGSVSSAYRAFTTSTSAATSDNLLVFTGTSAATLTLPTATTVQGRYYWIKNASSNSSTLTIATTSSQTIDGATTWTVDGNEGIRVVSNGANWYVVSETLPGNTGSAWVWNGNAVPTTKTIGTTSNYDLPFVTNNSEKMRITSVGNVGIGTSSFNGSNPEKLLVDAGSTSSFNVISGKGSINNYLQLNIQNNNSGSNASADLVASANNGNETQNYVDLGINSSTYSASSFTITGSNDGYLYSTGNDFAIGNASSNKVLKFFTGGTLAANERMRINDDGNVAIGTTTWDASNPEQLVVDGGTTALNIIAGKGNLNSIVRNSIKNSNAGGAAGADFRVYNDVNSSMILGINSSNYSGSSMYTGAGDAQLYSTANDFCIGNTVANKNIRFYTGGIALSNERMRINGSGNVGIGATSFNATNPEKLLVDAGTTSSYNVISGKGTINSYLQLNIQNNSSGNSASSDIVATADNGNEAINYVNVGINGSGNTSTGVLGGANTAYMLATGNDFVIGNNTDSKPLIFYTTSSSTQAERMRITGAGNIGIGCTAPNYKLQVVGDIAAQGGTIRAASAVISTSLTACSDIRFKKNVLPLNNALSNIMKLQGVTYDWKVNEFPDKYFNDKKQIGIIAQELEKVYPELVETDAQGYKTVDYSKITPVLIEAIKDQQSQIETLKSESATTMQLIRQMQEQLEALKKQVSKK